MKKNSIWILLYPIGIYYLISGFAFFALNIILGEAPEYYMFKQMICSGATIPFLWKLWRQDGEVERVVYGKVKNNPASLALQGMLSMLMVGAFGVAFNNLIAMTPLIELSGSFQAANEQFFAGEMGMEIAASCIVVPIAEELLFRGIILKRATMIAGEKWGLVCSAFLFGVIHFNLVQFLYATLLGLLLAYLVQRTRRISMAVFGHGAANLLAILRAETGLWNFAYEPDLAGLGFTALLLGVGIGTGWVLFRKVCTENYSS